MKIHVLAAALASLCLVSIVACDTEDLDLDKALKQVGDAAEKVSTLVDNLDTKKVEELAELAAQIEKDPSKATELLEKAGLSKEDYDKAIKAIRDNPDLKKIFDAAKKIAAQ